MAKKVVANNIFFDEVSALVAQGNEVEIPTKGCSMLPFIEGGKDSLILTTANRLEVGDIVLAKVNDQNYCVHRIVSIEEERVILMGDGNIKGCEFCTHKQITAKVKSIVHNGEIIDCNSAKQRRRAKLWRTLLPIRRYLLAIWRRLPNR